MDDLEMELAALLEATAVAHRRAFIETDGFDPEWPRWYAEASLERMRALLGAGLTVDRLQRELTEADESYRAEAPDAPWPDHYARRLRRLA